MVYGTSNGPQNASGNLVGPCNKFLGILGLRNLAKQNMEYGNNVVMTKYRSTEPRACGEEWRSTW